MFGGIAMFADVRWPRSAIAIAALLATSVSLNAQSAQRDAIADLISKSGPTATV